MKEVLRTSTCTLIKFDETKEQLIQFGWLGEEDVARIYRIGENTEIRIFKKDGQSYMLDQRSKDFMVQAKIKKLLNFEHDTKHTALYASDYDAKVGDTIQLHVVHGHPEYCGLKGTITSIDTD